MKKMRTKYVSVLQNTALTMGLVIFALSPLANFQTVHAQSGAVATVAANAAACLGLGSLIGAVTTVSAVPVESATINNKECGLDSLAYAAAQLLAEQLTQNIVAYINSGFDGNPAFIENPGKFFKDIGDEVAGELIYGSDLNFLCSPYQNSLRNALKSRYQELTSDKNHFQKKTRCTLTNVIENVEKFGKNDFSGGRLIDILEFTQVPQNNPITSYLDLTEEQDYRIAKAIDNQEQENANNNGFRSVKDANGNVVTPGIVIEAQLQKVLGQGIDRLSLADEFDEIIGALIGQLTTNVFSGGGVSTAKKSTNSSSTPPNNTTTATATLQSPAQFATYTVGERVIISWTSTGNRDAVQIRIGNSITKTEKPIFDETSAFTVFPTNITNLAWTVPDLNTAFTEGTQFTADQIKGSYYIVAQPAIGSETGGSYTGPSSQKIFFSVE